MKTSNIKFSPIDVEERKQFSARSGDTVRVSVKIKEGNKTRLQDFEGIIIARKHGTEPGATFTVRKMASGVGVERIFPLFSPSIEKIVIKKKGTKARKSKLYYIREKAQRDVRRKLKSEVVNEPRDNKEELKEESKTE